MNAAERIRFVVKVQKRGIPLQKKTMCPWALWVEEVDIGWVVVSMTARAVLEFDAQGYHNHDLYKGAAVSNANARNRAIPPHLRDHAAILVDTGLTIAMVYANLVKRCTSNNKAMTFTKRDVENEFWVRECDKVLDATNLYTHLRDRLNCNQQLYFKVHSDKDGTLDHVFFVMEDGVNLWFQNDKRVILLDTKHGTQVWVEARMLNNNGQEWKNKSACCVIPSQ